MMFADGGSTCALGRIQAGLRGPDYSILGGCKFSAAGHKLLKEYRSLTSAGLTQEQYDELLAAAPPLLQGVLQALELHQQNAHGQHILRCPMGKYHRNAFADLLRCIASRSAPESIIMLVGSTTMDQMHMQSGAQEKSFFDNMLLTLGPDSATRDTADASILRDMIRQRFPVLYQLMVEANASPALGGAIPGGLYMPTFLHAYVNRLAAIYAKFRDTVIAHRVASDADAPALQQQASSRQAVASAQAGELDQQQLARVGTIGVRQEVTVQQLWAQGAWFHPGHRWAAIVCTHGVFAELMTSGSLSDMSPCRSAMHWQSALCQWSNFQH